MTAHNRLHYRLARNAVYFTVLVGILISSLQIAFDFVNERNGIRATIFQTLDSVKSSAYVAAYELDRDYAKQIVEGLLNYPAIEEAVITDNEQIDLARYQREDADSEPSWLATRLLGGEYWYAKELIIPSQSTRVGTLKVRIDANHVAHDFLSRAWVTVLSGMARTAALAMILMLVFYYSLTRPLTQFIERLKRTRDQADWTIPGYPYEELNDLLNTFRQLWQARDKAERYLGAILRHAATLIYAKDTDGRYLVVNELFARSLKRDSDEILGQTDLTLLPNEAAQQLRAHDRLVASRRQAIEFEEQLPCNGGWHTYLTTKFPIFDQQGEVSAICGVAIDITDRKRLERAHMEISQELEARTQDQMQEIKRLNQSRLQTLSQTSHELRTPLGAIKGFAEIMLEDARAAGHEQYLDPLRVMLSSGDHLLEIVNDIVDLAKLDAGKMRLNIEPVDLTKMLDAMVSTVAPAATKNNSQLLVEVAPGLPPICTDGLRLRQILLNLLSNACKFTRQGTITLAVRVQNETPHEVIRFDVRDTGIGLSESEIASIFNEFEQTENSAASGLGSGLGLPISRKLCELLGGRIEVESSPGKGSTFSLILPLQRTDQEQRIGACL